MANTYQWAVNSMTAYPDIDGRQDVVFQVAWVCSGTDGTYNAAEYGSVNLTLDPSAPFTPYNELTLEQVNGWVQGALGPDGVAAVLANIDNNLAAQAAPPATVSPPLPWNS
jgi:hypothetical protein